MEGAQRKTEAEEMEGGGDMGQVGHKDEGWLSKQLSELRPPETLRQERGRPRKQQAEEMEGGGEGDHVGQENDTGLKHADQLDSPLKPTKALSRKRGRRRPRKIQADQNLKDEEEGEGGNAGNNDDILLNQRLHQLPRTSMELLPRKRGRARKRPAEGVKEEEGGEGSHGGQKNEICLSQPQPEPSMTLPQGISSPQVAVASESRRITRNFKAYLDECVARSALFKSPVQKVKTTPAEIHDHLTVVGQISASKSSSDHAKDWILEKGISSPEIAFAPESRCLTRNMKAYLDRCPARSAPLKSPVRNVMTTAADKHDHPTTTGDISAAKSSSYHVKNQDSSLSPASLTCPNLDASALPSETDNLNTSVLRKLGDQSISADQGLLDMNELAADLPAQNHGSGDVCRADPSDLEFVVDNYQPAKEAHMPSNVTINTNKETASKNRQSGACPSRSVSLNLTQMCSLMDDDIADFDEVGSRPDEALVSVNGYQVKAEVAPILRDIFFRYGDIAKNSTFCAVKSRSCLMENVCGIYKKLEGANFMLITPVELNSLLEEVRDLETVKIELGWLHYRLDQILEAQKGFKSLKEEKRRITQATKRRRQVLEAYNTELEALTKKIHEEENALAVEEAEEEKLNEKFINMKSTLKCFYCKSLVHGLL